MIMSYDSPELLLISSNIFYWPWKTWKQSSTEHVPMWNSPPSMVNLTYPASSETWPNLLIKCGHWTSSINGYKWCFYWCFDRNIIYKIRFFRWHPAMFDDAVLRWPPLCFQTGWCRKRSDSSRYSPPQLREQSASQSAQCTSKRKNRWLHRFFWGFSGDFQLSCLTSGHFQLSFQSPFLMGKSTINGNLQ